jgi:hypothetical protein
MAADLARWQEASAAAVAADLVVTPARWRLNPM